MPESRRQAPALPAGPCCLNLEEYYRDTAAVGALPET